MATEIDELYIKIESDSKSASESLDKLVDSITELTSSLSKLNTNALSTFTNNLWSISETINAFNDIDSNKIDVISKSMARIGKVDADKIKNLSTELPNLSDSLGKIAGSSVHSQNILEIANSLSKFGNKSVTQATANIPSITANFNSLVNAFTKSFRFNKKSVSTASQGALELATAFSRFGYKTSTEAIKNIPLLTKEFKAMLDTLSKTPNVSKDLIEFTKALSNLSGKTINFKTLDKSIMSTSRSAMNLTLSFGKLYAIYRTVIGSMQGLWDSVETASDYLETLNYFEESFGQIANKANLNQWKELGYESAESYANSFMERASELTSKLTGFNILPEGTLEFTGLTSLGVDPSQVMQYQAVFGQMASSMGVASETAVDLSNALTMIGLDLASVRNMDFEAVWEDMASGLAGMSRTLDKYGVNIRNVNLQQKLTELGIEANIASLNQNDKALLRTIILLENTDYAYGDLAETLNLPANQLRLLSSNMENLSRIIGNLFLPIVQTALPYINGFVIALQRMFTWVGTMMGIDLSKITESTGENPLENIIDGSEELEETLDGSLKASEKLKKSLRSFDELKTISSETASLVNAPDVSLSVSGGVLDTAFQNTLVEYQKAWGEAFANVENNAQEFADKIESYLQPVKNIVLDFQIGDYFQAGEDVSDLVIGITGFLTNAIDSVDWEQIGANIGAFMEGINWTEILSSFGKLFWEGINTSIDLWKGSFDTAPIETTILTSLLLLPTAIPIIDGLLGALDLLLVPFQALFGFLGGLSTSILAISGVFFGLALGLGYVFATNEDVRKSFDEAVTTIKENMQPIFEFVANTILPDLQNGFERLLEIFSPFAIFLEDTFTSVWQDILNPVLLYFGEKVIPIVSETLENLWNNVLVPLGTFIGDGLAFAVELLSDGLSFLWKNVVVPLAKAVGSMLSNAFESVGEIINKTVIPVVNFAIEAFQGIWDKGLEPLIGYITEKMSPAFTQFFKNDLGGIINNVRDIFNGLIDFITGILTNNWKKAFTGMVQALDSIFGGIKNIIKTPVNVVIGGINLLIERLQSGLNAVIKGLNSLNFDVPDWIPGIGGKSFGLNIETITLNKIKTIDSFEMGGYPKQSSLFWAGENGIPELMGTIGGRTAVAGGAEITGISNAIYQTHMEEMQLLREQNALLRGILEKEFGITDSQIFSSVRRSENQYYQRTGNLAFVH